MSGCLWGGNADKDADTAATGGSATGGTGGTGGTATGGTATGGTATGGTATGGTGGTATGGTATGGTGTGGTNAPPSAPIVELSPTDPTTADDVEAVLTAESEDPDGDAVTYVWAWEQLDGGGVGPAAAILPSGLTARGETWRVTVTATDGDLESDPVTADATIVNAAPAVTAVAVTPEDARVTDALTCVVETADADDDAVSVAVRWQVDGGDAGVGEVLPAGTPRGAEVVCLATPNDGFVDGAEVASAVLEIGNTPPTLADAAIAPAEPVSGDVLTCVAGEPSDADGDDVALTFAWFVDDIVVPDADTAELDAPARGTRVRCEAVPSDGLDAGAAAVSDDVVVGNAAPMATDVVITPDPPDVEDALSCAWAYADAEGDPEGATRVTWTVDPPDAAPFEVDDEVLVGAFARGDTVQCAVVPVDDLGAEGAVAVTSVVVGNAPPRLDVVALMPDELRTDTVAEAIGDTFDPDGDPVGVRWAWTVDGAPVGDDGAMLDGAAYFGRGQRVQVTGVPFDGLAEGEPLASVEVEVQNSLPSAPVVSLPEVWVVGEGDLTCAIAAPAVDPDGDALTYTFAWTVDGEPYPDSDPSWVGPADGAHPGDTVPDADLRAGEWVCSAWAADDVGVGTVSEAAVASVEDATWTQVAAGLRLSCALDSAGSVECWGYNEYGQAEPPDSRKVAIVAGGFHACGLLPDSSIECWGRNEEGQCAVPVGTWTSVAAGHAFSCATDEDGMVACWGSREHDVPDDVPEIAASHIAGGGYHACLLNDAGFASCWGNDGDGQSTPPGVPFTQLALGHYFSCGIDTVGDIHCWGRGDDGQTNPPSDGPYAAITAGQYHACAARAEDGAVHCWGWSTHGALDALPGHYIELGGGDDHTCAITIDGELRCWGAGDVDFETAPDDGQALPPGSAGDYIEVVSGTGTSCARLAGGRTTCFGGDTADQASSAPPATARIATHQSSTCALIADRALACVGTELAGDPPGGSSFRDVQVGHNFACVLDSSEMLNCWGDESDGKTEPPLGRMRNFSLGDNHGCAVDERDFARCWGDNFWGQASPPGGAFRMVAAGSGFTCGLRADGEVECWGFDEPERSDPPAGSFIAITAGVNHACALDQNGSASCWGIDVYGETVPPPETRFLRIAAGAEFTCGVTFENKTTCWGGASGAGTPPANGAMTMVSAGPRKVCTADVEGGLTCIDGSPVSPPAGDGWATVAIGDDHVCAAGELDLATCTGDPEVDHGQLEAPAESLRGLDAGLEFTCGLAVADDSIACWGNAEYDLTTPPGGAFDTLGCGTDFCCALDDEGMASCWGHDEHDKLDAPDEPFTRVVGGLYQACGLRLDGSIDCWGGGNALASPAGEFVDVDCGWEYCCGVRAAGSVECWGTDPPVGKEPAVDMSNVATAHQWACGLDAMGGVHCWGSRYREPLPETW